MELQRERVGRDLVALSNDFSQGARNMLPVDVLHAICSFLSGIDVFQYSHTNSWTLSVLSDDLYWQKRAIEDAGGGDCCWKQKYMRERALLFVDPRSASRYIHGMLLGCNRSRLAFAQLERPPAPGNWCGGRINLRSVVKDRSFSFDIWFCLFPGTSAPYQPAGGIIYGLQSIPAAEGCPGENPGHFVMVDMKYNLYCSVLNEQKVVARDLQPKYWYHLALTYNVELQRQEVFLDGKVISTDVGSLNSMWPRLKHEQIGTGFCDNTAIDRGAHVPHARLHNGMWYPLYGLIDEFRVWKGALSPKDVAELACCKQPESCSLIGAIKRSHDRRGSWSNVHAVKCSHPAEGKNVVVYQSK
ncbi:hypothetical protein PHMEG_0004771 [Phytophthora megakarya]|uniref:F-box domain-containing protein n=1 Tax=Phytophthora megakarya TaxID=4795 RepID=A0A225WT69_9STRA|nr:hypothetical protein PHMEG_0004771 [Phytophthora megakarya]